MGPVQKIRERLPEGSFIKNVLTLMTGTVFAQALLILLAPILTRLYDPEAFGVFALYTSIVGFFSVIACLRYECAIVLPEKDEDAANLLSLSLLICLVGGVIAFILMALWRQNIAELLGSPPLTFWLWFLPLSIIVAGGFQAFNYWSTRRKQFKRLALRQVTNSTVMLFTQIGTGAIGQPGAGGLISGHIIGQLAATGRLAGQIFREEGREILSSINRKSMGQMLSRYRRFPLYDSWSGLLNTASALVPALILAYFFNPVIVGFYALGQRVLALPMGVIGNAVAQAFFPRAAEAGRTGDLNRVTLDMFRGLLSLGVVPIFLIAMVAPQLFALVFGNEWYTAGEYVRWLSMWSLFKFISSPISTLYFVLERQSALLFFNIALLLTGLIALVVGGTQGDALLTIQLFGISGVIMYAYFSLRIMTMSGNGMKKTLMVFIKAIAAAIPYITPLLAYMILVGDPKISVIIAIVTGMVFCGIKARTLTRQN
ncbi:MAG: oligosaccharide flippase family protein [Syntrophomonadaceae bacterium]|nr:oligosaccharide flippase family protein [Syntrophomonadaceae bacterium]